MTRYRGRHRAPCLADTIVDNSHRFTAAAVTTGVMAAVPVLTAAPANAAINPDTVRAAIISCESGGNPRAQNPNSTASGLYQFINSTWKAFGGSTPRARDASVAEQNRVFDRAIAANGTRDWEADPASERCWRPKVGNVETTAKRASNREAPQTGTGKRRAPAVDVRNADGTGRYTCDIAHLYFEACDPDNLGEVVNYPAFKKAAKSASVGSRGTYVCDTAHLYFEACDPDNLGETVAYPARRS